MKTCGCTAETCGCCEGTSILTPASTMNRPGLDALHYRAGTHGAFLKTMKARLGALRLEVPGADGTSVQTLLPLSGLTTRDPSDPAIALLDSWAVVADVLTFYQERIANEGFLRTATERRSVLELARLVGYTLRPGVAATVFLAYTLDNNQKVPVPILAGARSQSIPGPDELPQMFETSEDLEARSEWNSLQVRLTRPLDITFKNALHVAKLFLAGTATGLKPGDRLLLTFGDDTPAVVRKIGRVDAQFDKDRTVIEFQAVPAHTLDVLEALFKFLDIVRRSSQGTAAAKEILATAVNNVADQIYLGAAPSRRFSSILNRAGADAFPEWGTAFVEFNRVLEPEGPPARPPRVKITTTSPAQFVRHLLRPPNEQFRSAVELPRSLAAAFHPAADLQPQLIVNFAPQLKKTFYTAWANATVNNVERSLKAVHTFRVTASLFGASVPKMATYDSNNRLKKPSEWDEWDLEGESTKAMFLDQAYDAVLPGSLALIHDPGSDFSRQLVRPDSVQTDQRTAYGSSGKTTQLVFEKDWRDDDSEKLSVLRQVLVFAQSEELTVLEEPISEDIGGQEIELSQLHNDLKSGRWVILTGERSDIPNVTGVTGTELHMISSMRQDFNPALAGDKTHTTILLATKTAYSYKRDKNLKIYANVVKATHGDTRPETLGSGDGSQPLQSFALKQPPLTFVAAPNPSGTNSTLRIYVNNIEWLETDTLAGLGPKDRKFITKTDDNNVTTAIFGNGVQGSRLPTGVQNINAVYRSGIGRPGNVDAEQISLLQSRPLGVKGVINPLRASGGADRESIALARGNAPLAVMSLDRLVSVQDYADFCRSFAGIAKAAARRLSDGRRQVVEITIAGADDAPIDPVSDLYRNLLIALRGYGDPALPVQLDSRELVILVVSVKIALKPGYLWDPVADDVKASILDTFGFEKRSLGQPALLCELIAAVQSVEGVAYIDVDGFGGIPEKVVDKGVRRLLDFDDIQDRIKAITGQSNTAAVPPRVLVNSAAFELGVVRPAQLAIFSSAVQDTIVLNQIL